MVQPCALVPELPDHQVSRVARSASFRLRIAAEALLRRRRADQPDSIARALRSAAIDLNPHQVEAAVRALQSTRGRGVLLADEVGLGKTIEAGLTLAQMVAEGRNKILILCPATLRQQWAAELHDKVGLESEIVDGKVREKEKRAGRRESVFQRENIVIASHQFAGRHARLVEKIDWDVVVIDEAHRLRGAHRRSKIARALREAIDGRPKLLLTATPMQNGLSELYGLLSFLDLDLLGPFDEFRRMFPDRGAIDNADELRERIEPHIQRTLRRQVKEYVRYTNRHSVVSEFTPTAEESGLYDEVTEYFADPEILAVDPRRRHLMVLVYRKLLASSPAAIAGTLERLRDGLSRRLENGDVDYEDDEDVRAILAQIEDEFEEPDEKPTRPPATPTRLRKEIARLDGLARIARGIDRPAKSQALLTALEKAFIEATQRGWPKKAVVFTESRRTQAMLESMLSEAGYIVATLHGQSGDAAARQKIIERFRDHAQILILTEAGAEGLNLQFANLVVNYDLPWNPQRIEQRIGRCHRYGQTKDVVVLNFLASDNAAESRLYELLSHKLQLFDGVFGATDEPLGALGDGRQFERRVNEMFEQCRDEAEISSAFQKLQEEVEEQISARMNEARASILEHFDDDIRARLKMTESSTTQALAEDEENLIALVRGALPDARLDDLGRLHLPTGDIVQTSRARRDKSADLLTLDHPVTRELIDGLRAESPSAIRYVLFDYTGGGHKVSRLAPLLGSEGWWLVYKLSFDGPLAEDELVHVVVVRTPDGKTRALEDKEVDALLGLTNREIERRPRLRAATLATTHGDAILEQKAKVIADRAGVRASECIARDKEQIERGLGDRLDGMRSASEEAQRAWERAREKSDPLDRERRFRQLSRALEKESQGKTAALEWRSKRLSEIDKRSDLEVSRSLVASCYFWLE